MIGIISTFQPEFLIDYVCTWIFGVVFSSIELGSRYKDDPQSVLTSTPGVCYMLINGLICCFGLYFISTFGLNIEVDDSLPDIAQRTADMLYASLGSFFIMRSSFLKLGGENSQLDLGLNVILKKLLEMIDREVDRVRAIKRSSDITRILEGVRYVDVHMQLKTYCLQVMQNITPEEITKLFSEVNKIDSQEDDDDIKKLSIGLQIYNLVGGSVLEAAVIHLDLKNKGKAENNNNQTSSSLAEQLLSKYGLSSQ